MIGFIAVIRTGHERNGIDDITGILGPSFFANSLEISVRAVTTCQKLSGSWDLVNVLVSPNSN